MRAKLLQPRQLFKLSAEHRLICRDSAGREAMRQFADMPGGEPFIRELARYDVEDLDAKKITDIIATRLDDIEETDPDVLRRAYTIADQLANERDEQGSADKQSTESALRDLRSKIEQQRHQVPERVSEAMDEITGRTNFGSTVVIISAKGHVMMSHSDLVNHVQKEDDLYVFGESDAINFPDFNVSLQGAKVLNPLSTDLVIIEVPDLKHRHFAQPRAVFAKRPVDKSERAYLISHLPSTAETLDKQQDIFPVSIEEPTEFGNRTRLSSASDRSIAQAESGGPVFNQDGEMVGFVYQAPDVVTNPVASDTYMASSQRVRTVAKQVLGFEISA